ncbi:MAG: hypothetical protein ACR2J0_03165 [Mycobacteriales bacterium]
MSVLSESGLRWLAGSPPGLPNAQTGAVVTVLLLVLLVTGELLRAGRPRDTARLLGFGVAVAPLCAVFALVVLERFQVLA